VTITVGAPDEMDFAMFFSPSSVDVVGGQRLVVDLVITPLYGFSEPIHLSLVNLPDGVTANVTEPLVVPPASVEIGIETLASIPSGRYFLEMSGSGGGKAHGADLRMDVNLEGVPNFHIAFPEGDGGRVTVAPGAVQLALCVTSSHGFSGPVSLNVQGLPVDINATFEPAEVLFAGIESQTNTSTLFLGIGLDAPGGNWSFTVEAFGSGITRSVTGFVNITPARAHVFITDLKASKKVAEPGSMIRITAVIENDGKKGASNVKVAFERDGRPEGTVTVSVPPGGTVDAVLNMTTPAGKHLMTARTVPGKGYETDDTSRSVTIRGEYSTFLSLPWSVALIIMFIVIIVLSLAWSFGTRKKTGEGKVPRPGADKKKKKDRKDKRHAKKKPGG
jgi:hypothetical protein